MNRYTNALGLLSVMGMWSLLQGNNTLNNVFYHQGTYSDRIVFYFDKAPHCNIVDTKRQRDANFIVIKMKIDKVDRYKEVIKNTIEKLRNQKAERGYSIECALKAIPKNKSMLLTIRYDPQQVIADYATCESISAQRAVVINFHNKKVIDHINQHTSAILHMAQNRSQQPIKVVLDCGHGGVEVGKMGHGSIMEKNINLQVGKQVAQLLRKKGYAVFLTRDADTLVPLDVRTTYANTVQADLFVSIHANAGPAHASGLETYWTPKNELMCTPFHSDSASKKKISQRHTQLDASSKQLADTIRTHVLTHATVHNLKDRKTKKAVSQVLLGTDMPSTLVELGFLSHKTESAKLADASYQALLAQGICAGIDAFCQCKAF
ncbi:MAG: N-acetylmuramoyl-L-alanine amidase [Candidatus Babeliales bacterium]